MKNVFFLFLLVVISLNTGLAQIAKGGFILGGELSYSSVSSKKRVFSSAQGIVEIEGPNRVAWSVEPGIRYLFNDQLAVGIAFGYTREKLESIVSSQHLSTEPEIAITTHYFIHPNLTYYTPFKNDRLGFLIDMYLQAGKGKVVVEEGRPFSIPGVDNAKFNDYGLGIDPGLYFFVSPTLILDFTIGGLSYSYTRIEREKESSFGDVVDVEKISSTNFFFSDGVETSLGVNFFFGGKSD